LALALSAAWKVALVVLATFPVAIAASAVQMQAMAGQQYDTEGTSSQGGVISTAFANMRTVAAFSVQFKVAEDYAASTRTLRDKRVKRAHIAGLGFGFAQASNFFTYALLFWYGSTLVATGEITFVNLMVAILTLMLGKPAAATSVYNQLYIFICVYIFVIYSIRSF
jgi:ATP-binding cassette subfamily B (MDR/TAP) protein 1